jgi:hypothetical protein
MKKVIIVSAVLLATAGVAQTGQDRRSDGGLDPDDQICRSIKDTGTRLGRTRVCMSRAEWAQQRRDTKQNVERTQTRRTEKQF